MPEPSVTLHVEFEKIKKLIESAMEAEIGFQFTIFQTGEYL